METIPPLAPEIGAETFSLDDLNAAQREAVIHDGGPVLVIAGAGSGKTRTLVYRVAYLVDQGVAPESILLLTFTRRAAQEMLWRAARLTGSSCRRVMGGTFHATANILLRRHGHHLGIPSNFTIIDRADAESIVNLLKSSLGLGGKGQRFPSKRIIVNILSGSINKNIPLDDLVYGQHEHLSQFVDDLLRIGEHYHRFKEDHQLMDYDDLLVNWRRLLADSPAARAEVAGRFRYVMVDEYQDTNHVQAEIVRLLAQGHKNVMVVGDDAQSIYSFRGADFYNIMRFPEEFEGVKIVKLEENYRSTQRILDLGNAIIARAEERFTKTLFTSIQGGARPLLLPSRTEADEGRRVAGQVRELLAHGTRPEEIAVLFRSAFHSYKLEMELHNLGHKFEKRGGLKLTESAHVKDLLSFLRVQVNPADNLSWNRILLLLPKVGPKTAQKLVERIKEGGDPVEALASFRTKATWGPALTALAGFLERLRAPELTPVQQFDLLMDYYEPLFKELYADDYPRRRNDLDQLRIILGDYANLQDFVDDTTLDPPESSAAASPEDGLIVLSTIHSAKGLEWDHVFVIGLSEGRFPHGGSRFGEQYEEERRLLYVAATRARKELYLSYSREITQADRQRLPTVLSPFVREINPGLYEVREPGAMASVAGAGSSAPPVRPPKAKQDATAEELGVDMKVSHPLFGRGRIVKLLPPRQVEVAFERYGLKLLHLDYARLRKEEG